MQLDTRVLKGNITLKGNNTISVPYMFNNFGVFLLHLRTNNFSPLQVT